MQHIPSIAFSSCNYDENADLTPLRAGKVSMAYACLALNESRALNGRMLEGHLAHADGVF
jgi:hypothetical protein